MDKKNRKPPFFVLGAQRSGTTVLRLMLNAHPNLAVPDETGFFTTFIKNSDFRLPGVYGTLEEFGDLSKRENANRLLDKIAQLRFPIIRSGKLLENRDAILARPISTYADLIAAIMSEYAKRQGKSRWGDKTPQYTPDIDLLWQLFPGCKIIHLVRDGRDSVLAQLKVHWASDSLWKLAQDWRWKTTICHKVGATLGPVYFLEVRYEELIFETEKTLRAICDFLEEPFEPTMLRYYENAEKVFMSEWPDRDLAKQAYLHSLKPPDPNKVYAWRQKMSLSDRIIFEQIAGRALELFGYELEHHSSTLRSRLKNLRYALIRRW